MSYRLGVDIGGTFTDGVLVDETSGAMWIDKVLTTTRDRSEGFLQVAQTLVQGARLQPEDVRYVMHATTTATNAVLERRGAEAALLVTRGFRDVLEIARQVRHELYNLQTDKPTPLVPRARCLEIPERLDYRGEVLEPLDEAAVEAAAERLKAQGVDAIAVCFLHAYRNPEHEQRARQAILRAHPEAHVSLSSEIAPEIREYWRASTTVVNAYVAPVMERYLRAVEDRLASAGIEVGVHVMQSSGGVATAAEARRLPVHLIESGPAAGVSAAARFADLLGLKNAISFDMGGTTAKMGLIVDGQPRVLPEYEVSAGGFSGTGLSKGSGYPVLGAVMDLVEVGAGGGSIGWVDSGGLLRVGPRSAGADPGPASYARGGTAPTVTDANVLLGRLGAESFLGGTMPLDTAAARQAIERDCACPLGMDTVQAAMGLLRVANATMTEAIRLVSVQRGYDPREFALVAFGGAGPLHATALAAELGMPLVVVPPSPGVASAWGLLLSDLRHDYRATVLRPLAALGPEDLEAPFRRFEDEALRTLAAEGVPAERATLERFVEARYLGQSWKLTVPLAGGALAPEHLAQLRTDFDREHERAYGFAVPGEPVEVVSAGLRAVGAIARARMPGVEAGSPEPSAGARRTTRPVFFAESEGWIDTAVYDRYALQQGNVLAGPCVVEERDSSTLAHPGWQAQVVEHGMLVLTRTER